MSVEKGESSNPGNSFLKGVGLEIWSWTSFSEGVS